MALTYQQLEPGDLLLCYGWNGVGVLQGAVKGLHRLTQLGTLPLSVPIHLASNDPVPFGHGTAKCNHAIVVGQRKVVTSSEGTIEEIGNARVGEKVALGFLKDKTVLKRTLGKVTTEEDITALVASKGRPDGVVIRNKKVSLLFSRSIEHNIPRLCHSTGGGCVWTLADGYLAQHTGGLALFRLRPGNGAERLAAATAEVASTWATELGTQDPKQTQYSMWKATLSAFGSHSYGSGASGRAANYRKYAKTAGGPPSDRKWGISPSQNTSGKKEWFCSMFAIACYQAASLDDNEVRTFLPLDARHTSPMTLDGLVRTSNKWQLVGQHP